MTFHENPDRRGAWVHSFAKCEGGETLEECKAQAACDGQCMEEPGWYCQCGVFMCPALTRCPECWRTRSQTC